jgi:hypothetical protein
MTDESDVSPARDEPEPASHERADAQGTPGSDSIQSLTDFFDQMDHAAFKRVLANRDAHRATLVNAPKVERR